MTGQRTHRYLRLALVGVVIALGVSIVAEVVRSGTLLPSISDYYYTPVRGVFVGVMTAAAVALLALSGRDTESLLLDIAAVFAPLVAIVPTGFAGAASVPESDLAGVRNALIVYAVMVALLVVAGIALAAAREVSRRRLLIVGGAATVAASSVVVLAFAPPVSDSFPFPGGIDLHLAVTVGFFLAFAAVPALSATRRSRDVGARGGSRAIDGTVAVVIVLALIATVAGAAVARESAAVLIGESVALVAFAVYWLSQTIERWDDPDPPSLRAG